MLSVLIICGDMLAQKVKDRNNKFCLKNLPSKTVI